MTFRLALLDDYQGVATQLAPWHELPDVEVTAFSDHLYDLDAVVERLLPYDGVMAMRERTAFPRELFVRLPNLRLVVTTGPFNAVIDLQAAADHGVVVCGTGGSVEPGTIVRPSAATAELTWGLIFAVVRQIPAEDAAVRAGGWQHSVGVELNGRILGVIGLGHLGRQVAAVGRAIGMDVVAWSQNLTPALAADHGTTYAPLDELLERSVVATIHLKLSERTRGLISEPELRRLGPDSYLVNTSRGPIVEESALVRALEEGWIAGAGLDTFDEEPLRPAHPLRRARRAVLTPHIGYVTDATYASFYADAFEDVRAFLAGAPIRTLAP